MTRLAVHIEAFRAGVAVTFTLVELRDGVVVFVGWVVVVITESWATRHGQS
jgi:hypothetical protein